MCLHPLQLGWSHVTDSGPYKQLVQSTSPPPLPGDHRITDGAVTRWKHWGVCITNLTQESRQTPSELCGTINKFLLYQASQRSGFAAAVASN